MIRKQTAGAAERLLWGICAVCLGCVAFAGLEAAMARRAAVVFAQKPAGEAAEAAPHPSGKSWATAAEGDVVGRVAIPDLQLDVPMTVGVETDSLVRGVGHIRGTALPGGLGTLGLAGHRDTYFRPLRHIAPGMVILVVDATGTYRYQVDTTEIVLPEQVEVLAIRDRPELTLVTCYPFDFVGHAPKRFIVHAHLLSLEPDGSGAETKKLQPKGTEPATATR